MLAIFEGLQRGQPDRGLFTPELNSCFDAPTTAAYARTLGPLGPPTAFRQIGSADRGGMKFYDYRIVAGGRALNLSIYTTAEGRFEQFLAAPAMP